MVALALAGILFSVAYFMNVGGLLVTRARLQTMAEFSAAAGGRMVAEQMGARQYEHVAQFLGHAPTEVELRESGQPHLWLTAADVLELQDAPMRERVRAAVSAYLSANQFPAFPTVSATDIQLLGPDDTLPETPQERAPVTLYFPVAHVACATNYHSGHSTPDVLQVKVMVQYAYPFLLPGVVNNFVASDRLYTSATGVYLVKVCQ